MKFDDIKVEDSTYWDDMSGKQLDKHFVDQARAEEMTEFAQFNVYTEEDKSWFDAQAQCQTGGGQLASIKTEPEQDEFEALDINTFAWIGARQEGKNGQTDIP